MQTTSLGSTELLLSGRLGRKVTVNRSDNAVYIDSEGQLCCKHGERAPTIQAWLNAERVAKDDIEFSRPSFCDCKNIDGLLTKNKTEKTEWPKVGCSLYKCLGALGAQETNQYARPQRFAITTNENSEIWVQPSGTLVCKHGNSKKLLKKLATNRDTKFRSSCVTKCYCSLSVPRRVGSVFAHKKTIINK
jgi:hypothetical protein